MFPMMDIGRIGRLSRFATEADLLSCRNISIWGITMKREIFVVVFSSLLTGCMVSQLAEQEPIFTGNSKKSPQKYTQCLAPKWQDLNPTTKAIETEDGYQVSADNALVGAVSLARIRADSEGGSEVKVYAQSRGIGDPWGSAAKLCL